MAKAELALHTTTQEWVVGIWGDPQDRYPEMRFWVPMAVLEGYTVEEFDGYLKTDEGREETATAWEMLWAAGKTGAEVHHA